MGGGQIHRDTYRDAWIRLNAMRIKFGARGVGIADDFLGCICYAELIGTPPETKHHYVLPMRHYYWAGPEWDRRFIKLQRPPGYTSVGAVKIQIREAAMILGLNGENLTYKQQQALSSCLELDTYNLNICARLIQKLIHYDFPNADPLNLTDEQWIITGSRYNRGTERALGDFYKVDARAAGSGGAGLDLVWSGHAEAPAICA